MFCAWQLLTGYIDGRPMDNDYNDEDPESWEIDILWLPVGTSTGICVFSFMVELLNDDDVDIDVDGDNLEYESIGETMVGVWCWRASALCGDSRSLWCK